MNDHIAITCPCGSTDFRGRIEPTFRLRYTDTTLDVLPVPDAPTPIDVYCNGCKAGPWNIETCPPETALALAMASAEMTLAVTAIHRHSRTVAGVNRGETAR